jgi:hypothetical protein
MLHEHAASLSAASHANRSRRLNECAKESGRYQDARALSVTQFLMRVTNWGDTLDIGNRQSQQCVNRTARAASQSNARRSAGVKPSRSRLCRSRFPIPNCRCRAAAVRIGALPPQPLRGPAPASTVNGPRGRCSSANCACAAGFCATTRHGANAGYRWRPARRRRAESDRATCRPRSR